MPCMTEWSTSEVQETSVGFCNCPKHSLPITLIHGSFFPGSLQVPEVAFSFDIMIFYLSLNATSMTPVAPFRNALFECLAMCGYEFSSIVCHCHGMTSLPLLCTPLAASDPICLHSSPTLKHTCTTYATTLLPLSDY